MTTAINANVQLRVSRVTITPALAMKWLESNVNNRVVSQSYVERLARDMKAGRWVLTHEGIAFDPHGTLLDGQHRLWAIVQADVPVEMHVWFNVAPEALGAIDCGKPRRLDDVLRLTGAGHGYVTRRHVSVLRAMLGGVGEPVSLTAGEASDALARHGEAVDFAVRALPESRFVSSAAVRAVFARAWYSADHEKVREFGRMLSTGIVPDARSVGVILLRQHLQNNTGGMGSERHERYAKTERALLAYLRGEQITRLYATTQELFPLPEETAG